MMIIGKDHSSHTSLVVFFSVSIVRNIRNLTYRPL